MDAALRKHCQKRKAALLAERAQYEPDWRDVADYVDPYAGRYLTAQKSSTRKLPSRQKIISSVAAKALRTMDAGFMGGHTSKSRPWFRLGVSDMKLMDQPGVRAWLDDVTGLIRDTLARSNFYTELPDCYHDRHLFGVSCLMVEEDDDSVLRFYQRSVGTYAAGFDKRGRCNSLFYNFEFTASQIKEFFGPIIGEAALPQKVKDAISRGALDQRFWIDTLIEPNPDHKKGSDAGAERKFRQVYWMDGCGDDEGCLDYQGRFLMPALVSRWSANGFDSYGPSPALDALGDIKQIQYLEGKKLYLIDMQATPPLGLPEHMRNKGGSITPGARMFVTPSQVAQKVEPIYVPKADAVMQVQQEIATVGERVSDAFFATLFRMLDYLDDRTRTAYEISERKEEKVAMLGPAIETLSDEVLDPVIDIAFFYLDRRGMIPAPPPALDGVELKVEYTSMLAQAAKAAGTGTIDRVIATVAQIATAKQDVTVWDKLDIDSTIELVHDAQGAPARMLRSDEEVADIREGREQQQRQAQMAQMAPAMKQGAEAMKTLNDTEANPAGLLGSLAGAAA